MHHARPVYRFQDIRALGEALRADPAFSPEYSMLTDARGTESIEATSAEIRTLATDSPFGPGSKQAIIATQPALFGIGRVYEVYAETLHRTVQLFRCSADAFAWLGVEPTAWDLAGDQRAP